MPEELGHKGALELREPMIHSDLTPHLGSEVDGIHVVVGLTATAERERFDHDVATLQPLAKGLAHAAIGQKLCVPRERILLALNLHMVRRGHGEAQRGPQVLPEQPLD